MYTFVLGLGNSIGAVLGSSTSYAHQHPYGKLLAVLY